MHHCNSMDEWSGGHKTRKHAHNPEVQAMHQPVVRCGVLLLDLREVVDVLPVCVDERVGFKLLGLVSVVFEVVNSSIYLDGIL